MGLIESTLHKLSTPLVERIRASLVREHAASHNDVVRRHLLKRIHLVDDELRGRGVPYLLLDEGRAIVCTTCHLTSHHPLDVREKYCGRCHVFHDNPAHD
jgi:hypothetical protein